MPPVTVTTPSRGRTGGGATGRRCARRRGRRAGESSGRSPAHTPVTSARVSFGLRHAVDRARAGSRRPRGCSRGRRAARRSRCRWCRGRRGRSRATARRRWTGGPWDRDHRGDVGREALRRHGHVDALGRPHRVGVVPSSRARTSSVHTPVALTTTLARTLISTRSSSLARAHPGTGRPAAGAARSWTRPAGVVGHGGAVLEAAVRTSVRVRRASSARASKYRKPATRWSVSSVGSGRGPRPCRPRGGAGRSGAARQVVEPQGRGVRPGHRLGDHAVLPEQRDQEGEGGDQVRRVVEQALALGQVLVDQAELALLQVAEASVDHLGGLRRRARGEVGLLDQRGAQPPACRVEGDARRR